MADDEQPRAGSALRKGSAARRIPLVLAIALAICFGLPPGLAHAELKDENVIVPLPDGYVVGFDERDRDMRIVELVPKEQTVENWTDMITIQTFFRRGDLEPAEYERRVANGWKESCPNAEYLPLHRDRHHGYAFSFFILHCPSSKVTGHAEFTYFKAIQGQDAFYSVQKAFDRVPAKSEMPQWIRFMREVFVCDTRLVGSDCPGS